MNEGDSGRRPTPASAFRTGSAAFRHRNFRLFWTGQVLSLIGTWMQSVAQSWLVLTLTDSALQVGLVVGLQFLPVLFLGLFGGVLADRLNKRRFLIVTQSAQATQALLLGLLTVTGQIEAWQVLALAAFLGVINAFDMPTRQAFVVEMVGRGEVMNALALNSSAFNLARIVGPAIGGLLVGRIGAGPVFLINATSYVAVLGGLLLMRESELFNRPAPLTGSVWRNLGDGLRYIGRTPIVLVATTLVGLVCMCGMNYSVLLSVMAKDVFTIGSAGFGLLMASLGVGSVTAALFIAASPRLDPARVMVRGAIGFALLEILFALSPRLHSVPLSFALLFGVGFCMILLTAMSNTAIQRAVPDELRGRVMSVYVTVFAGSTPFGSFMAGSLAGWKGAPFAWGVGACLALLAALWALLRLRREGLLGQAGSAAAS
ncbi:MAG: MFS transporter [Candidatus Eisenbacteria bacterium]|nr:MFS transporter [Candidatus Eisenbacteria bacterium]